MKARTAMWVAIPVAVVLALGLAYAGWMVWLTRSTKTDWALPDGYTADLDGSVLTLYDWGGDCDWPLSAEVVRQDEHAVTVLVMRHEKAGPCDSVAVLHQVDVWLAAPIGDRRVLDRSGVEIPGRASRVDAEAYRPLQEP
jgi:hypothetical protein